MQEIEEGWGPDLGMAREEKGLLQWVGMLWQYSFRGHVISIHWRMWASSEIIPNSSPCLQLNIAFKTELTKTGAFEQKTSCLFFPFAF